jgi:hypothetical protein
MCVAARDPGRTGEIAGCDEQDNAPVICPSSHSGFARGRITPERLLRNVFLRTLKIGFALKCRTNLAPFCQKKGVGFQFNLSIILPTTSQRSSVQSKIVNPDMHLAIKREWICLNFLSLPETRLRREGTSLAGEDYLDAPDLEAVPGTRADPPNGSAGPASNGHAHANEASGNPRRRAPVVRLVPPVLAADLSGQLRDRLLEELVSLQSSDEAANWAHQSLPAKNTLTVADAQLVEDGFRLKIAALGEAQPGEPLEVTQNPNPATAATQDSRPIGSRNGRGRIAAKTIRLRDKDHRKFVSSQACLVCGRLPADAHHLRFAQPRALGRKVSDEFTVPVCRVHHRELHRHGDEAAWWQKIKIDPLPIARRLWQRARPNDTAVAIDGDAESGLAIALVRPEQRSVATIPDHREDLENVASVVTDRPNNP